MEAVLRARRVVTPEGSAARWVGVRGGRIVVAEPYDVPSTSGFGAAPCRATSRSCAGCTRRAEPVDVDAPRGELLSRDQGTGKPNR